MMTIFDFKVSLSNYRKSMAPVLDKLRISIDGKIKNIKHYQSSKGASMTKTEYDRIDNERKHIDLILNYIDRTEMQFDFFERVFYDFLKSYGEGVKKGAVIREDFKILKEMLSNVQDREQKWIVMYLKLAKKIADGD